jgi:hypothetical protein
MPWSPRWIRAAVFLVVFLTPFSVPPLRAQQPGFEWPVKPKNIKVLPKDMKPEQLRSIMVGFTRSLGVRCSYCHVGEEGKPLTTYDFPADAKPEKQIARDMYRMLGDVNGDLKKMNLKGTTRVNMWCHTCHHGHARPTTLAELMVSYTQSGYDSAVAAYDKLRARYYGRDAFDFSENGLVGFAEAVAGGGHDADAIRILELNVEKYPQSPRALDALARTYEEAGQKDRAIEIYRKMLEVDPQNRNAERRLEALQGTPK